jgi:hypothetical protein
MTNNTNTGGPAFPVPYSNESDGPTMMPSEGMTLRDYFAAKAMQGLIACPETDGYKHDYAKWAYEYADAMLKAREA